MNIPRNVKDRVGAAICLMLIGYATAEAARAGKPLHTAAGVAGFAGAAALFAALLTRHRAGRPELSVDENGTLVTATRTQRTLTLTGQLGCAVAVILLGYLQYRGQIGWDIHGQRNGRLLAAVMPVLLPAAGLLSLPWAAWIVQRWAGDSTKASIRLDRDGVTVTYSDDMNRPGSDGDSNYWISTRSRSVRWAS